MDWLVWLFESVKWLAFELPKPENLTALVDQIGPVWVYVILFAIIFSETGLLVGFFLPGDSLLFAAGLLTSQVPSLSIVLLNVLLIVAAIVGDAVNYFLGLQMGEHVLEKGRLRFVKHEHLMAAHAFYERHGGKAIILARFMPLVRTFTPFVAGVARMNYWQFAIYNIAGGIGWVVSITMAGYLLGDQPLVREHFEKVVLLIVFVSILPLIVGVLKHWLTARKTHKAAARESESSSV